MKKLYKYLKLRYFAGKVARIAKGEIIRGIMKEDKVPEFFPQEGYETCLERMQEFFKYVMERPAKIAALAAVVHRMRTHKEDREDEKVILDDALSTSDSKIALGYSPWGW